MKMEDFAEKVCAAVKKELGSGYDVKIGQVKKNNNVIRHGLQISVRGENIAPTIYLESFLEFHESGIPFQEVIGMLLSVYQRDKPDGSINMDFFRNYGEVEDRICYRLVGKDGNKELLKDIPHVDFLDLAVCFYYACPQTGFGDGSILIHNSHMEMWGVCTEDLYCAAQANTPRLFPWECSTMEEVLNEIAGPDDEIPVFGSSVTQELPMKVLSNSRRVYGASCILYPGALELAAEGKHNLYILPSSIHEVILLQDNGEVPPEVLKKMIYEVNCTQVAPEEVLSDSLYYYDLSRKEIVIM